MRVMVFGTYDTAIHPRVGILVEGLRRHGVDVVECNVPLGQHDAGPTRPPRPGAGIPRSRVRHARCLAELAAQARRAPRPDVVLCGYQGRLDIQLARTLFRGVPLVLDHLETVEDHADRVGETREAPLRTAARVEAAAVKAADLLVLDTEEHRRVLREADRDRAVVIPIGAAQVWFDAAPAAPRPMTAGGPLRIISVGYYSPVQGAPVIGDALRRLDGFPLQVTMIGRGLELDRTRELVGDNGDVTWRPWVPEAELPALVAAHDVALGVFGTDSKALRLVPNKVFQSAAAGCAQVTSDTAPQRRLLDKSALLTPPGDPEALADALRRLVTHPLEVDRLRTAARALARERFTAEAVTAPLVERLAALAGKRASPSGA